MTWWRWVLVGLVAVAIVLALGFRWGVLTQRKDDADARLTLRASVDSVERIHAATIAGLKDDVSRFSTSAALAEARAIAAERKATREADAATRTRAQLAVAMTAADSLSIYPALVDTLTRQIEALDSTVAGYRAANQASVARSGALLARIAADSTLIAGQAKALAGMIPPPPPRKSGWGCVAGIGIAGGIRSGAGIGITCGRRLG